MSAVKTKVIFTLKNGKTRMYTKGSSRRFIPKFSLDNWKKCHVYVTYGKAKDVNGKMVEFYNEGDYENKHDAIKAYRAFIE